MSNARILLVTNFDAGRNTWTCWVYMGSDLQTQAEGRDQGAAVADAVAKFRTARGCRKAG